jgi:hypothetical protein
MLEPSAHLERQQSQARLRPPSSLSMQAHLAGGLPFNSRKRAPRSLWLMRGKCALVAYSRFVGNTDISG